MEGNKAAEEKKAGERPGGMGENKAGERPGGMEKNKAAEGKDMAGEITVEGLSEVEAAEVREIFKRFVKAYKESGEEQERFEWLERQLQEELPGKTKKEILKMKTEIVGSIKEYDKDLRSLSESMEQGGTKERWFADRIGDAAKGMAVNEYGGYLNEIHRTLEQANKEMVEAVTRLDGGINQCKNLDGFIAEQHHVNSFNAKAALQNDGHRAEVVRPKPGEGYRKNSVDIYIRDLEGKIVHRYQSKFGKDAEATAAMLKGGDYRSQGGLVGEGQVEGVQGKLPNKRVTDHIGGTDKVSVKSDPLTKEEAKRMQQEVQQEGKIPEISWNVYNTRELAINLGKQAGVAGMHAALFTTGFSLAGKVMQGEEIDGGEVVETAIRTGADAGVKAAAGGALTVASEKGVLSVIPKGTMPGTIAKIACIGVENVKILWKVAKGELTMSEGLEHMGRTSTAMVAGLSCTGIGVAAGAMALSWIPGIGMIAGGLIGGMVGYAAGSKIGEAVFNGAKKVAKKAKEVVGRVCEGAKQVVGGIIDGIRSLFW
ncbi:MAG: hypothetical protein HFH39_11190 [Lachnospiraceae bacterium]|nr:hypothetical protein [Lachnospiraceae bacterium]